MADYLEELVQKITTRADLKGFDDLDRKQRRAIKTNDILGQSFRRAFGIFFGIQGVRSIIQASREFDLLQRSISGLTGSTQDWEYLRKEAYRTGTDLTKAAGAYKNFYSAANMAGFDKGAIQGMFSDVLTAGRGIGANQQQIGAALLALEQMLSKGKVSMEELRRQMGNALPGAFEIAAKSMGVTTQEFNKMLEAGLDANVFVPRFTAMLRQEFGKGFEANIKSLDFALENLNNAWKEFQANILQGEAGEALAQLVNDITRILKSQELLNFIKLIGKALEFVIKHIKIFLELFAAKKILEIVAALKEFNWRMLDLATNTQMAGTYAQQAATAYSLLFSEANIQNAKALGKSLWALVAPLLKVMFLLEGIKFALAIIQDLWLFFTDSEAYTFTGYLASNLKDKVQRDLPRIKNITTERKDEAVKALRQEGKRPKFKLNKQGLWDLVGIEDVVIKDTVLSAPTGGAAPIFNTDLRTPDKGYIGELPNLSNASQNSKTQSNNITININAPNSQPETIAQSVEDALANFFKTYKESYA